MYTFSKSFIDRDTDEAKCTIVEILIDFNPPKRFQKKLKMKSIISAAKILAIFKLNQNLMTQD